MNWREAYRLADCEQVDLWGCHTTRPLGFCDMLLSRRVVCSLQVSEYLRDIQTHRSGGYCYNETISFTLGQVSYRYSGGSVTHHSDYRDGVGILLPLDLLLQKHPWKISHCSKAGGIPENELSEANLSLAIHSARVADQLDGDGFGNLFELLLMKSTKEERSYPQIKLMDKDVVVAVPEQHRAALERLLYSRQKRWDETACTLAKWPGSGSLKTRLRLDCSRSKAFLQESIEPYLEPFSWDNFNMLFYQEHNLQEALFKLSLLGL